MKLKNTDRVYQWLSYDTWGNARDGYEVNDIRSCGTFIVISAAAPDKAVNRAIMRAIFERGPGRPRVSIDWLDETMIELEYKRNGYPIGRFQLHVDIDASRLNSRWGFPYSGPAAVYYVSPRGRVIDATGRYE